jgi:hypothetical protein
MKSFILVEDNFLSEKYCKYIIEEYKNKTNIQFKHTGYNGYILKEDEKIFNELQLKIIDIIKKYEKMYPEINLTKDKWALTELIFKHFKPGNFFSDWHSEVGLTRPSRVLNMMIYLSEHDCGTQFFNQDVIKSRIGRLTIFPSYFTHTHRGQICPDNKDRYILGGYYNFIDI